MAHAVSLPPAACHHAAMSQGPCTRDLSRACWRCQFWGGLVADAHARCTRLNSTLQADPVTGCVHWAPGAGDKLPAGWRRWASTSSSTTGSGAHPHPWTPAVAIRWTIGRVTARATPPSGIRSGRRRRGARRMR